MYINIFDYFLLANEDDESVEEYVYNKEEVPVLDMGDESSENKEQGVFTNFLNDLMRKYTNFPSDKNCSDPKNLEKTLEEFCRKYEDDIKNAFNNMKDLLENNDTNSVSSNKVYGKGFIEPDISDDEAPNIPEPPINVKKEPPKKKMKYHIEMGKVRYPDKSNNGSVNKHTKVEVVQPNTPGVMFS